MGRTKALRLRCSTPRLLNQCIAQRRATVCKCATNAGQDALRCCGEDEGRPLGAAFQREAPNRPLLLRSKDVVVSEWEKLRQDRGQVGIEEMSASKPPLDVSKVVDVVETGGVAFHRDLSLRGALITAQTATGIEAA